ncbi:hypothetical protein ACJX0J_018396, partial [Zea mays]
LSVGSGAPSSMPSTIGLFVLYIISKQLDLDHRIHGSCRRYYLDANLLFLQQTLHWNFLNYTMKIQIIRIDRKTPQKATIIWHILLLPYQGNMMILFRDYSLAKFHFLHNLITTMILFFQRKNITI